jgi:ribosome maturation factor RimP
MERELETPEHGAVVERVRSLVEEVIAGSPLFVVDVDLRGRKGSQAVDIFVESDESLDVETLARVSREVGFLLDTQDVIGGRYHLTVSSPGLDRPLRLPRQYRKNLGRPVRVHYRKADGTGNAEVTGPLASVDEAGIEVGTDAGPQRVAFDQILWAKVQLPW